MNRSELRTVAIRTLMTIAAILPVFAPASGADPGSRYVEDAEKQFRQIT